MFSGNWLSPNSFQQIKTYRYNSFVKTISLMIFNLLNSTHTFKDPESENKPKEQLCKNCVTNYVTTNNSYFNSIV